MAYEDQVCSQGLLVARISIYISDELKARMDAIGAAVNWSEVVRPAIISAVAGIEHLKGRDMNTAIERLRASRMLSLGSDGARGKVRGREWAEGTASFDNLRRVAAIEGPDYAEGSAINAVVLALNPYVNPYDFDFIGVFLISKYEVTEEFAKGFIEGAQEFYNDVRDHI